jgi:hypothetical protein
MTKENKSTHDKHEHAANMNWLQVLALGTEVVKQKAKYRLQRPYSSVFAVLP